MALCAVCAVACSDATPMPQPGCSDWNPCGGPTPPPQAKPDAATTALDDAVIVQTTIPDAIACAESHAAIVKVRNTGSATWTRGAGYFLGASASETLVAGGRVDLGPMDSVGPGATFDFTLPMTAPLTTGLSLQTSWRMTHDKPFGAQADHMVGITCDGETMFGSAKIYNSPPDTATWPITTKITKLEIRTDGIALAFSKKDGAGRWPDVVPPGWDGPIQYTLWIMMRVGGQWAASGIIQYWYGLEASGGDVTKDNQIAKNWVYDGRWGTLAGHQPAAGEAVGFMVTAGNARGVPDASQSIRERSDMVVVPFPQTTNATFNF